MPKFAIVAQLEKLELGHEFWMRKALAEAHVAYEQDEVPIGALVVLDNKIIGKGYNQTERLTDVTAHAEILAITGASAWLNSKYLDECVLYVTIEPCLMCAGAIKWARFHKIVYGASEPKFGFSQTDVALFGKKTEVIFGVMADECGALMKEFFKKKRN